MPKQSVVTLSQFRRMKGTQKTGVAIQLTSRQWAAALKGLRFTSGKPPKNFSGLRFVETPSIGGGFVLPECPSPCRFQWVEGVFRCSCTAQEEQPDGGEGTQLGSLCGWSFGSSGSIRCHGRCGTSGHKCLPRAWRFGRFIVWASCTCRRP